MVVIICAKDKRDQALEQISLSGPHEFASPTSKSVNYSASKAIIVGNYPAVEKRYRGIMPVEVIELNDSIDLEEQEG